MVRNPYFKNNKENNEVAPRLAIDIERQKIQYATKPVIAREESASTPKADNFTLHKLHKDQASVPERKPINMGATVRNPYLVSRSFSSLTESSTLSKAMSAAPQQLQNRPQIETLEKNNVLTDTDCDFTQRREEQKNSMKKQNDASTLSTQAVNPRKDRPEIYAKNSTSINSDSTISTGTKPVQIDTRPRMTKPWINPYKKAKKDLPPPKQATQPPLHGILQETKSARKELTKQNTVDGCNDCTPDVCPVAPRMQERLFSESTDQDMYDDGGIDWHAIPMGEDTTILPPTEMKAKGCLCEHNKIETDSGSRNSITRSSKDTDELSDLALDGLKTHHLDVKGEIRGERHQDVTEPISTSIKDDSKEQPQEEDTSTLATTATSISSPKILLDDCPAKKKRKGEVPPSICQNEGKYNEHEKSQKIDFTCHTPAIVDLTKASPSPVVLEEHCLSLTIKQSNNTETVTRASLQLDPPRETLEDIDEGNQKSCPATSHGQHIEKEGMVKSAQQENRVEKESRMERSISDTNGLTSQRIHRDACQETREEKAQGETNLDRQALEPTERMGLVQPDGPSAEGDEISSTGPQDSSQAVITVGQGSTEDQLQFKERSAKDLCSNVTLDSKKTTESSTQKGDPSSSQLPSSKIILPILPRDLTYSIERTLPVADGKIKALIKGANLSEPLPNGWKLFPHQKTAVIRALKMRRLILAYDMGLGKTIIACVWAKAFSRAFPQTRLKVYVVAPVSLHKEWMNTAMRSTRGVDYNDKKVKSEEGKEVDSEAKDEAFDIDVVSWAKIPDPPCPKSIPKYIVVCDEAHSMQSMASSRTKRALKLMESPGQCIGCLLLTGTPMKNGRPANIFPLLKAVAHPFGEKRKAFERYFCDGREKSFGRGRGVVWDATGSSNLPHLNAHIASHVLRLTKEECLKDLPPKTRVYRQVPVSGSFSLKHAAAVDELKKFQMRQSGKAETDSEAVLAALTKIRYVSSLAKVDGAAALAETILATEPAVVMFTSFVDTAKMLHSRLESCGWAGELLTGETPPKKRQSMVDNFQAGLSAVFVCTFGAGGVGLTLTAASTIILLDRPWTPGEAQQAEDRVRRIGQTRNVTSVWMRAFPVDQQIDNLIEQKMQNANTVVDGGKGGTLAEEGCTAISGERFVKKINIAQLVQNIMPENGKSATNAAVDSV